MRLLSCLPVRLFLTPLAVLSMLAGLAGGKDQGNVPTLDLQDDTGAAGELPLAVGQPFQLRSAASDWIEVSVGGQEPDAAGNLKVVHAGSVDTCPQGMPVLRPGALAVDFEGQWMPIGSVARMEPARGRDVVLDVVSSEGGALTWHFSQSLRRGERLTVHVRRGGAWRKVGQWVCGKVVPPADAPARSGVGGAADTPPATSAEAPLLLRWITAPTRSTPAKARKTVAYSGRADADGRQATLTLDFDGKMVSGRLFAQGVMESNMRLPSTDVSFGPVALAGPWEDPGTRITAAWTGGDYSGGILMPDYPTNGTININLKGKGSEAVVYAHRVASSSYGYTFARQGVVYDPGVGTNALPPPGGKSPAVGVWEGSHKTPSNSGELTYHFDIVLAIRPNGALTALIRYRTNPSEQPRVVRLEGRWWATAQGVSFRIDGDDEEDDPVNARLSGANTLVIAPVGDDNGPAIVLKRRMSSGSSSGGGSSSQGSAGGFDDFENLDFSGFDGGTAGNGGDGNDADGFGNTPEGASDGAGEAGLLKGIRLVPSNLQAAIGMPRALPKVYGIKTASGEMIEIHDAEWQASDEYSIKDGKISLAPGSKPDARITLRAVKRQGKVAFTNDAVVRVVTQWQVGKVYGRVNLSFDPAPDQPPKQPGILTYEVTLQGGPGAPQYLRNIKGGDSFLFDELEEGQYTVTVKDVRLSPSGVPGGYAVWTDGPGRSVDFSMPRGGAWTIGDESQGGLALFWPMRLRPDTAGSVHGRVTYKDNPVKDAEVSLIPMAGGTSDNVRKVRTDERGEYVISVEGLAAGRYAVQALKMMGPNPQWASRTDLMDIASNQNKQPLEVSVPLSVATGGKVDIPCLSREEIFPTGSNWESDIPHVQP